MENAVGEFWRHRVCQCCGAQFAAILAWTWAGSTERVDDIQSQGSFSMFVIPAAFAEKSRRAEERIVHTRGFPGVGTGSWTRASR